MEATEIRKLAALEDRHWWYAERRQLLTRMVRGMGPGRAVDIGAAAGGNTRTLKASGWAAVAVEYGAEGAEVAHERGLTTVRGDALHLPVRDGSVDLAVCFDVLEHLEDDKTAAVEMHRVLRSGGTALIAVPADPKLWSRHDEAVSHVRRYTRPELVDVMESAGFAIEDVRSWNVIMKPAAAWRRRSSTGSDLDDPPRWLNSALGVVIRLERYLPVGAMPGVSLLLRARKQ